LATGTKINLKKRTTIFFYLGAFTNTEKFPLENNVREPALFSVRDGQN